MVLLKCTWLTFILMIGLKEVKWCSSGLSLLLMYIWAHIIHPFYRFSHRLIRHKDLSSVWPSEAWRRIYLFTLHCNVHWSVFLLQLTKVLTASLNFLLTLSGSAFDFLCRSTKRAFVQWGGIMHFFEYRQGDLVSMSNKALQCSITLKGRDLRLPFPSSR